MSVAAESNLQEAVSSFKELDERISHLNDILSLISWDQKTMAPKKGRQLFSGAIGTLSTEIFKLITSKEMNHLLSVLTSAEAQDHLDAATKAAVRERAAENRKLTSIPEAEYKNFVILTANANSVWEEAKEKGQFSIYEETLEKIVSTVQKFAEYYGYQGHPYDALLEEYEPGLTVEILDPLFADLREKSIQLLNRIKTASDVPESNFLNKEFSIDKQKAFNRYILPKIGFDMEAGRLDETVHPFAQQVNTGDVRITTRYNKDNLRSAIFGTIHEAGHGMYEQGVDPDYEGTAIRGGTSFGIHESQSRFYENFVGRSVDFWKYFFHDLKEHFPEELSDVSLEQFYRGVNTVEPSFIRVEADELTYNLHIMLRYEIEKGLIEGSIAVKDLPEVWNSKMKEYLGITPPNDSLGVLQDIHWSFGGFGYFPSYSLGNLYAAQIYYTMKKEIADFDSVIKQGEFRVIREWLRKRIHQHGKLYKPNELIKKVTGEALNANYLVRYLEEKYTKVYNLSNKM
ncbi:carboxypeptidase M32 [Peribacillus sp. SCS-155]|uniref:carboxypeptidase M32 n=1 Tax=Peribacillus sedimenti TaxID=3115297 RepID=UPI003905F44E